jgi:hypothetical protein
MYTRDNHNGSGRLDLVLLSGIFHDNATRASLPLLATHAWAMQDVRRTILVQALPLS